MNFRYAEASNTSPVEYSGAVPESIDALYAGWRSCVGAEANWEKLILHHLRVI
jgi:hypothetical protein